MGQCGGRKVQRCSRLVTSEVTKRDQRRNMITSFIPKEMTELQFPEIRIASRWCIPITRRPCEHSVRQKPLFRYPRQDCAVLARGTSSCADDSSAAIFGTKATDRCSSLIVETSWNSRPAVTQEKHIRYSPARSNWPAACILRKVSNVDGQGTPCEWLPVEQTDCSRRDQWQSCKGLS